MGETQRNSLDYWAGDKSMRLNWRGLGQKHYDYGLETDSPTTLQLKWETLALEHANVYCIKSFNAQGGMKILLLIRIYDFAWQEAL